MSMMKDRYYDEPHDQYVERSRRERYENVDPDQYAVVPAKKKNGGVRIYEEMGGDTVMSTRDAEEREMGKLRVEEQRIKNKIANERLAFDMQKRQQAKEMHEIKVTLLKKYPNIIFNGKQTYEQAE